MARTAVAVRNYNASLRCSHTPGHTRVHSLSMYRGPVHTQGMRYIQMIHMHLFSRPRVSVCCTMYHGFTVLCKAVQHHRGCSYLDSCGCAHGRA
eukprot:3539719-Prymnesium_polylepis.1